RRHRAGPGGGRDAPPEPPPPADPAAALGEPRLQDHGQGRRGRAGPRGAAAPGGGVTPAPADRAPAAGGEGPDPAELERLTAEVASLLATLCEVPSPSRDERAIADHLSARFQAVGATVTEDDAASSTGGNAGNLVAELPGGRPGRVLLAAHMDTVPLVPGEPLRAVVEGSVVRSTGRQVLGAEAPVGARSAAAVAKEDLTIEVRGRRAHAALEPERGVHAVLAAAEVVRAFPLGRVADDQVANVGRIEGGGATNVVPDEVTL